MNPLITTVRALRELATGLSPDAVASSEVLFEVSLDNFDVLLSAEDAIDEQKVVVMRGTNQSERYVPDHLVSRRREVVSRMAFLAERARSLPFALPHGWGQFKRDNLIAFYATPSGDRESTRWIAEVLTGEVPHVVFWKTTTSSDKTSLEEFATDSPGAPEFGPAWAAAFEEAQRKFSRARRSEADDVEVTLPQVQRRGDKPRTFDDWMEVISDDQRAFIDARTSKAIRLRGPAGSGKTVAIVLKAVKEVMASRSINETLRVGIVTHSWALAAQIDRDLSAIGFGPLPEIDTYPLLALSQLLYPQDRRSSVGLTLIGDDSFSGKQAQLDQIREVVEEFVPGDWVTFRNGTSKPFRGRFDSPDSASMDALVWDLFIEFGSVIGAAGIFPGAGMFQRYERIARAPWMMPLITREDRRVVFELYTMFMGNLEQRSLVTSDQVFADFLSFLEGHVWNIARKTHGYDLVFVDEFHLFNPLERQVLPYLSKASDYPRLFMAVDPRQSPSEAFIGVAAEETRSSVTADLEESDYFDLTTVHRFTPQILNLIKHVHHMFPTFELGHDWDVDFSRVESARVDGPVPQLVVASSRDGMENDLYGAVQELYGRGRIAVACVDERQWQRFSDFAARLRQSARYQVSTVSGRSDVEGLGYRRKGVVVAPAEHLAGLQFEAVLVAGVPDLRSRVVSPNERTRTLSLLYLALSRAEADVRVFVNDDDGGPAEVLSQAVSQGLLRMTRGNI